MFFDKPLFKKDSFNSIKENIGNSMICCSINSVFGFLLICDWVKTSVNTLLIEDIMTFITTNLLNDNFVNNFIKNEIHIVSDFNILNQNRREVFYSPSDLFFKDISSHKCNLLQAKFFYYYFTRMPILLRMTRFDSSHSIPNKTEQREILSTCLDALECCYPSLIAEFPHIFSNSNICYDLSRDVEKAKKLTGFLTSKQSRDDFVYDYKWIFKGPTRTEGQLLPTGDPTSNFQFIIESILDRYFCTFWNTFRDYYAENICFLARNEK